MMSKPGRISIHRIWACVLMIFERGLREVRTLAFRVLQTPTRQATATKWLPITRKTLRSLPPFVAAMVSDLATGDKALRWCLKSLDYDWDALDDLPVNEASTNEIWTYGWLRRSPNGVYSLSPVGMRPRVRYWQEVFAWMIERQSTPARHIIVWRIIRRGEER